MIIGNLLKRNNLFYRIGLYNVLVSKSFTKWRWYDLQSFSKKMIIVVIIITIHLSKSTFCTYTKLFNCWTRQSGYIIIIIIIINTHFIAPNTRRLLGASQINKHVRRHTKTVKLKTYIKYIKKKNKLSCIKNWKKLRKKK